MVHRKLLLVSPKLRSLFNTTLWCNDCMMKNITKVWVMIEDEKSEDHPGSGVCVELIIIITVSRFYPPSAKGQI